MTMKDWIAKSEKQIAKALPSAITPERFARMATTAVTMNPDLGRCTPASFIGALLQAAALGLEPNTPLGQAYLIPYNNYKNGVKEAQFQIGYRGLIELAHRSGEFQSIEAHVVYENDEFEYELGLDPKLRHKPALSNRGKPILYYAMFRTKDGGFGFQVMSYEDCLNHAKKYSKAYNGGFSPWSTNFDEMAKKTTLKKALKYAPLKSDFLRGLSADGTIKSTLDPEMFDVPNEVDYADYVEVDQTTGEVLSTPADAAAEVQS